MNPEKRKEILQHDITSGNQEFYQLLFAAIDGNLEEVQTLLGEGVDPNQRTGAPFFSYPVIEAARQGRLAVVKYLLEKGANVNANMTSSALIEASANGDLEMVKLLVERGARVNLVAPSSLRLLFPAPSALFAAVWNGHSEVARFLLENGADTDVTDDRGASPLIHAAVILDLATVEAMIGKGAKVDHRVEDRIDELSKGSTAMMAAASKGRLGIVRHLISAGAQIDARNKDDLTALHYAAKNGHLEVVRLLVEKGANIEAKGGSWSCYGTPLKFAEHNSHNEVGEFLRSKMVSTRQDSTGEGCFIATAVYGCYQAPEVRLLRRWRDEQLLPKSYGPLLVAVYHVTSPSIAAACTKLPLLKWIFQKGLEAIIKRI